MYNLFGIYNKKLVSNNSPYKNITSRLPSSSSANLPRSLSGMQRKPNNIPTSASDKDYYNTDSIQGTTVEYAEYGITVKIST